MRLGAPLVCTLLLAASPAGARMIRREVEPPRPAPGVIDLLAVSSDGQAALTLDDAGTLRFWPTLDGKREPVVVDVTQVQRMALAPRPHGYTLAIVDTAGGGKILRAADGKVEKLGTIPLSEPITALVPFNGGGRLLAIGQDSTMRLYDEQGKLLAKLEARDFNPTDACAAPDGKSALIKEEDSIRRLSIGGDKKPTLTLGDALSFGPSANAQRLPGACSPDGKRYAFLETGPNADVKARIAGLDGGEQPITLTADLMIASVGWLDDHTLLFSPASSGIAQWKLDLEKDRLVARPGLPPAQLAEGPHASAGGRAFTSDGPWLLVQDVDAREQRYLGYLGFAPGLAAVSKNTAAWASVEDGLILIEDLRTKSKKRMRIGGMPYRLSLTDDDHLLVIDEQGIMRLLAWRTGKLVDSTWAGYLDDLSYEPSTHLLRLSTGQPETYLWEIGPEGFKGPYIIADGGLSSGLIAANKASDPALWTLDASGVRREYTLAELKGDLTLDDMKHRGSMPDEGAAAGALAIDSRGRRYLGDADATGPLVYIYDGKKRSTTHVPLTDVSQIVPSPDGEIMLVGDSQGTLVAFRTSTLAMMWAYSDPQGMFSQPVWSQDGHNLALAGGGQALVIDAKTGKVLVDEQNLGFQSLRTITPGARRPIPMPEGEGLPPLDDPL